MATPVTFASTSALALPRPIYDAASVLEASRLHRVALTVSTTPASVDVRISQDLSELEMLEFLNSALRIAASRVPADDGSE